MRLLILAVPLLAFLPASAQANATPITLQSAFDSALKRNESVAIQQEAILQAEELYSQAKGALLPMVTGFASHQRQEQPASLIGRNFSPAGQTVVRVNATQPIFRGLREFAALRQQTAAIETQKSEHERAALALYGDVVQTFHQVLALEQDLRNYAIEIEVNQKRQAELRQLSRVGRSRAADVLTIEANIAALRATVEGVRGQLANAREGFAFVTALPSDSRIENLDSAPARLEPLETYLKAARNRPDLKSQEQAVLAAEEGISLARGAHLPSIDLGANYWFERPGLLQDVHWDASISMSLPIYAGGQIQSQVRQALSVQRQSELALQRARRLAEQEIRSLFQLIESGRGQIAELEKAATTASRSYQQQLADYRMGLVTNVDVLQSLNLAHQAQRQLDRSRILMVADTLRMEVVSGLKPIRTQAGAP